MKQNAPKKPRVVGPEDESRRTDKAVDPKAQKAGVESLPDGEKAAAEEAKKARDD